MHSWRLLDHPRLWSTHWVMKPAIEVPLRPQQGPLAMSHGQDASCVLQGGESQVRWGMLLLLSLPMPLCTPAPLPWASHIRCQVRPTTQWRLGLAMPASAPDGRPTTVTMGSVVDPQFGQKDLHPYVGIWPSSRFDLSLLVVFTIKQADRLAYLQRPTRTAS